MTWFYPQVAILGTAVFAICHDHPNCLSVPLQISIAVVCLAPGRATVQAYRKACWSVAPRLLSVASLA